MNYRHLYHAGNFADVVKHVAIIALVNALQKKSTPFCYIDTHAGRGFYDLQSESANKTKEFEGGIEKIIQAEQPPHLIKHYLHCVHQINNQLSNATYAALQYYPGSPMIIRSLLRQDDRMIVSELQSEEYQALKNCFAGDRQVAAHHMDGFLGLKAFLPPKENRGIILIDPPYEDPNEYERIAQTLPYALKRFPSGSYGIWYPIKEKATLARFYQSIQNNISNPVFVIELTIHPDIPNHLNGCGLIVINPPWQFDESIQNVLPWLWNALSINKQGTYQAYLLK